MWIARIQTLAAAAVLLLTTVAGADGQVLTVEDYDGARVGVRIGYGSQAADIEASVDSPLLIDLIRIRGTIAYGRWATHWISEGTADLAVTRFAATLVGLFPLAQNERVRRYVGIGISSYVPHGGRERQRGARFIAGVEGSSDRWTVGPEIELNVPHRGHGSRGPMLFDTTLPPMLRIGIAIRMAL